MVVLTARDPSSAYLQALEYVMLQPQFCTAPRGQAIREILNFALTIERPSPAPLVTRDPHRNVTIAEYTANELRLYGSGNRNAEDYGKISKFWLKLANPDGTINSAYGHLVLYDASCGDPSYELPHHEPGRTDNASAKAMRTPFEWARNALIEDKDTRQAIVKFHKRDHLWVGNKDQVCTIYSIFHIRRDPDGERLYMTTHMRSQDLVKGMVYDLPWFAYLQEKMVTELKSWYPHLKVGPYTHVADSAHIYTRDVDAVRLMLGWSPAPGID